MARTDRMAEVAAGYIERKQFASLEWYVEAGGIELNSGQVGVADAESGSAIPADAIYRIYSMTKPVVSVMAMILIEQGKLRLYDFLATYDKRFQAMRVLLPNGELQPAVRPIMVEDLITHRAGFTYEFITGCHIAPGYDAIDLAGDGSATLDEMMGKLATQPLAFQPGTQFRYSVCTDVLAHVCERAAGRPMGDLLKEYIFEPLGMDDTAFFVPEDKRARIMSMYGVDDIKELSPLNPPAAQVLTPVDVEDMYPSTNPANTRGGHGLFSTLKDYSAFARMLLDGKAPDGTPIISRKMWEMMQANRVPPGQLPLRIGVSALPGYGWGLGVRVMMDTGQAVGLTNVGEFGWAGAASTYFWVDPAEKLFGVIMSQYLGSILPMSDDMRSAAYQMLP